MIKNILFKQRTIWLPTIWLWLVIGLVIAFITDISLIRLAPYLAKQELVKADVMVVEGWMEPEALTQAYEAFIGGQYRVLITTGGPEIKNFNDAFSSYAEQSADYLKKLGVPTSKIISIPTPASAQNRTYLSAVILRKYIDEGRIPDFSSVNVYTADVHARRTHYLYLQAFRDKRVDIGIYATKPTSFKLNSWWQTSHGAKRVITEFIGWLYAYYFFTVPTINSHEEMWGYVELEQAV